MKTKRKYNQKGFTLVELLIYISGLLVIGFVLIVLLVQFFSLYKEIVSAPRADRTALLIIDRITKEIRSADRIDMVESQFGSNQGILSLDSYIEGASVDKKFYTEDSVAYFQQDEEDSMPISSNDFTISNFNFEYVPTSVSEAVRFTMEIQYEVRNATETKSYTGFAILRESYE